MDKRTCFIFILSLFLLSGCAARQLEVPNMIEGKQLHRYVEDIDVVVTDVDRKYWYVVAPSYTVNVSVENRELRLTYTDTFEGFGYFGCPPQWEYHEGDVVKAELYSWVNDSTREVVKQEIHKIY